MCNMYIREYGEGWVFRGDAKLAHSAVWLGGVVEGRDFCFGGTRNWRIARFRWGVFRVCGSNDLRYKPVRVSQAELVRPLAAPTN